MSKKNESGKTRRRTKDVLKAETRGNYFGETVRELRLYHNYTQDEAAEIMGITQSQWSAYENGSTRPHLDMVLTISEKFNVPALTLVGKCFDKTKFKDPVFELQFMEYPNVDEIVESIRRKKVKDRVKEKMGEFSSYINAKPLKQAG